MDQLKLNAVDARFQTGLLGLVLGIARFGRWDITCGFCQESFRKVQPVVWSSSVSVLRDPEPAARPPVSERSRTAAPELAGLFTTLKLNHYRTGPGLPAER